MPLDICEDLSLLDFLSAFLSHPSLRVAYLSSYRNNFKKVLHTLAKPPACHFSKNTTMEKTKTEATNQNKNTTMRGELSPSLEGYTQRTTAKPRLG